MGKGLVPIRATKLDAAYSGVEAMPRKAPTDPRTPMEIAQIEAARARAKASAARRPRDAKGRLLPASSIDGSGASPVDPADASKPDTSTDTSILPARRSRPKARYKPGYKANGKRIQRPKAKTSATAKRKRQPSRKDAAILRRKAISLTKTTMGAPSLYSEETANAVLSAIAAGASLNQACKPLKINPRSVWTWRERYPDFLRAYDRAAQARADAHAEEIIDIADNADQDVIRVKGPRGNEIVVQNTVGVQRAKLKIGARQWLMGKAQPEKYGDIKTIRDERHPLDSMTEEEKMQATLELVAKVRARLDQARALGLLPPKESDAECEDVRESGEG
jgi:hypothetical protein